MPSLVSQTPVRGGNGVYRTSYSSLPVSIPNSFLAPLKNPSTIQVEKVDFSNTLPEYKSLYAVVLDNVLSQKECDQLIHMAEQSAGAHTDGNEVSNNGWRPALVNVGKGVEALHTDYRNSDRIIWDNEVLTRRLWDRVLQADGMKDYLSCLDGQRYSNVLGTAAGRGNNQWLATEQGVNERMRFLKYGSGQFFREHCDGCYRTPDGSQRSFFTLHLYLNDSAKVLGLPELSEEDKALMEKVPSSAPTAEPLRGGATTFYSNDRRRRMDVDPKAGRVLIFQHRGLLHSGDEVLSGIKYTMRSDLMYRFVAGKD